MTGSAKRPHRASKSTNGGPPRDAEYFYRVVYTKSGGFRFTQDSPILPDVFVEYGTKPQQRVDLLLTPDWSKSPGELADELKVWLGVENGKRSGEGGAPSPDNPVSEGSIEGPNFDTYCVAHNQSVVAVRLTFEELISTVLPMSGWWQKHLVNLAGMDLVKACRDSRFKRRVRNELIMGLRLETREAAANERDVRHWIIRPELIWAARLFWVVAGGSSNGNGETERIADYFLDELLPKIGVRREALDGVRDAPRSSWVYSVNLNRTVKVTVQDSIAATKADAAVRTFDVRGEGICWAIVDTGIDARHMAFRRLSADGRPFEQAFGEENNTRIKATYDFSGIRELLSQDQRLALKGKAGRMVDWEAMEKDLKDKLRVPHTEQGYRTPLQSHGTHVAGVLAADWRPDADVVDPLGPPSTMQGMDAPFTGLCPEIELYDLRVFNDQGVGEEFAVMSALQFVRSLNQRSDKLEVHGVNLSIGMAHDVRNYACGRSPVCEECTRLVGNGVVVVAAAGNEGRSVHITTQGQSQEGYRVVGIADPGNTEAVITVGSTHRREPHTYGVSYFSSRGPTGDGRAKPDLVAPGEKIRSTVPGDGFDSKDGTSQAAPHVSGAAALLMCRHTEMIGQPERIKKVLMETATDLGREKHYQGAGLVDVMRALQRL